jgi:hypothetical protein
MTGTQYLQGRKQYLRPQAIIWSDIYAGTENGNLFFPDAQEGNQFLILSDHNRSDIFFTSQRIENRKRLINGSMRSYHVADKLSISWNWTLLPSRAFANKPVFDQNTGKVDLPKSQIYTADAAAGGVDILNWYEDHQGPFLMYLAYDRYDNFSTQQYDPSKLMLYSDVVEVYFSNFDYSVVKRGGTNHDLWNISVDLEEV